MDRFETDCVADSGGVVHIDVGAPGRRVHVVVDDSGAGDLLLGDWIARLADDNPNRPAIPMESLDREVIYDRRDA